MKNMNLQLVMITMVAFVMGIALFIMSTAGLPKSLFFTVLLTALVFSTLCAVSLRRLIAIEEKDHTQKVLDIIFSTFELQARLPKYEDIIIEGDKVSLRNIPALPKSKVDSFEHHL